GARIFPVADSGRRAAVPAAADARLRPAAALALGMLTPLVIVLACAAGGIAGSGLLRAQGK
ncbi:hypothetical protein ACFO9J_00005, partial [Microbulbifer halophilus]